MIQEIHRLWDESELNDGIELISGQHILAQDYSEVPIGFPYLTGPADFQDGTIHISKYTTKPKRLCDRGDILITVKGSGAGKIVRADQPYCISRQLMAIRVTAWHSDFVYYYLESISHRFERAASGLIPGISREEILNTVIPLPPLPEQRKIAAILGAWDAASGRVEQLIAALQRRKQGLMQRLLTGAVRFPEFVGTEWSKEKAGNLFQPFSQRNNGDEELLSVTQEQGVVPRSMLDARVVMPAGSTEGYKLVEPGDFIISLRSFQGGIEYSQYRGLVSPAYTVLKPKIAIVDDFYKHLFKSREFIARLGVAIIGIRDGKQINYADFAALRLANPSLAEQQRIAEVLDTADREIALQQQRLAQLQAQKKGLMQRLLTGQVRVKVDSVTPAT